MFGNIGNALRGAAGTMFGSDPSAPGWEDLQRRREIADMLRSQAMATPVNNWGDGVGNVMRALGHRFMDRKLDPLEDQERTKAGDSFQQVLAALGGGGSGGGYSGSPMPSGGPMGTPFVSGRNAPTGPATAPAGYGPPGGDMATRIRDGLIQRGLPDHVAEGFVANFQDESGLNPGINEQQPLVPGSRGGFGLAQWTGPRRIGLEKFAEVTGRPLDDVDTQLDYLMTELQGPERGAASAIMSSRDPGGAAAAIASEFLRPAPEHLQRRVAEYTGGGGYSGGGGGGAAQPNMDAIAQISELLENPYLGEGQRAVAKSLLQQQVGLFGADDAMTEYQRAQLALDRDRLGLDREKMAAGTREGPKFYGNIQWAERPNPETGEPEMVPYQIGSDGSVNYPDLGEGARPLPQTRSADLGTSIAAVGPGGQVVGPSLAKDLAGAEREEAIGAAEGEAIGAAVAGIGGAEAKASQAMQLIDSIVADPALAGITGMVQGRLPPMTQAGTDLNVKVDQLRGKTFLEAFESLKGGGAITEREGLAATEAIARLNRAQSTEEFSSALTELRGIMATGLERTRAKAAKGGADVSTAPAAPADFPGAPPVGSVMEGHVYMGGDPADPASWRKQ